MHFRGSRTFRYNQLSKYNTKSNKPCEKSQNLFFKKEDGPLAHPHLEFSYYFQNSLTQTHQSIRALHL